MIRRILRFQICLFSGAAILVGAVLAVAPASADAGQAAQAWPAVQSASSAPRIIAGNGYNVIINLFNNECLNGRETDSGGVTMQPCNDFVYPQEDWTAVPTSAGFLYQNNFNHECLNGRETDSGGVTMQPCNISLYPQEGWSQMP